MYTSDWQRNSEERLGGCWSCPHWQYDMQEAGAIMCEREGFRLVMVFPDAGCAFWERLPGVDDVPQSKAIRWAGYEAGGVRN